MVAVLHDVVHPEHPKNLWRKNVPLDFSIDYACVRTQFIFLHQLRLAPSLVFINLKDGAEQKALAHRQLRP